LKIGNEIPCPFFPPFHACLDVMKTLAQDLFVQSLELPGAERDAFLMNACGDDAELYLKIQRLLVDAARADAFFGDDAGTAPGAQECQETCAEQEGDVVGSYKLRQRIGEGGFGTVWMAERSGPISRMVALKVIKAGMDTKQVLARFEAERQALAMLDHPNIAKVLDAGTTSTGRPYFAMELVKGIPITEYCDEAELGTTERLALFRDVCAAINHAHQKGIIHRDIKPSNVMITLHGVKPVVKVIDFGVAKATQDKLTDQAQFTRFEQFIDTPVYLSPEQASPSGVDIDTRSDIYALGILLYELLVGTPPFDAKSLVSAGYEKMRRIICEIEPPKPSSRLGKVAGVERTLLAMSHHIEEAKLGRLVEPDLDCIVMKAIAKDRTRRYETANALARTSGAFWNTNRSWPARSANYTNSGRPSGVTSSASRPRRRSSSRWRLGSC
jgi:serine/threonine protein kinase